MKKIDCRANLMGLSLVGSDLQSLLGEITSRIENSSKLAYIFTPNPEQMVLASRDKSFFKLLEQGEWLLPDGVGIVLSSKLLALKTGENEIKHRIPGVDLTLELLRYAQEKQLTTLILGGKNYLAGDLQSGGVLTGPGWQAHWSPGFSQKEKPTAAEEAVVVRLLKRLEPTIIFVALGAPWQERWLVAHRLLLEESGVKLGMAVGGSFDFILGKVPRAPAIWQQLGLEWLYRLVQQPWRWRRQLQLFVFIWLVLKEFFSTSGKEAP